MKDRIIRLPLVVAIAALMGWLGLHLMFLHSDWRAPLDDIHTQWVIGASILLWTTFGLVMGRRELKTWLTIGLVSPLLGCLIVFPPASFAFVMVKGYIAFPVGMVTGVLVWQAFRIGRRVPKVVETA